MDDVYPVGPERVPEDLTRATSNYKRHAWMAMGGLLLFMALYVSLCVWFTRTAIRNLRAVANGGDNAFWMVIAAGAAALLALFLIKALFAVLRSDRSRDVELTRDAAPQLFAFLDRLAAETGAPRPHRVFLSAQVNAAVFYDLSLLNLLVPSKKNLVIGLGLVNVLTLGELKAVLAHEFGHFAQRSMAVGRWVYVAQQIAGHIVARRDWFDSLLSGISRIDFRIAWFGWLLRLIVWSLRALLDSAFRLVILAERALSREMEFQADLVSVSVTGSDALIHALFRLDGAETAWDQALSIVGANHAAKRSVPDMFEVQTKIAVRMRAILNDEHHDVPPELPSASADRPAHRVFDEDAVQAPRMWSTHPGNRAREDNAKRRYVSAPLDDRSAWVLFGDPAALRRQVTAQLLAPLGEPGEPATAEQIEESIDKRFSVLSLSSHYRGAYLARSTVLDARQHTDLYSEQLADGDVVAWLDTLYPQDLSTRLKRWRALEVEHTTLENLQIGATSAAGGVIRHRGRALQKAQLPGVLAEVRQERDRIREELASHDRVCRTAHVAAAEKLGRGWNEYLRSLGALLHYAGHAKADVVDAGGHLGNVFSIVVADGSVSSGERKRLTMAAAEAFTALWEVFEARAKVVLPEPVSRRMEVASWAEALPGHLGLPSPEVDSIGDWMQVIDSWQEAFVDALADLEGATLDALLQAEAHVADCTRHSKDPGDAPGMAAVPGKYTTRVRGSERKRQKRLDLWDRFVTADGFFPGLGRAAVALGVVGAVLGFGSRMAQPQLVIFNGLERNVTVSVAGSELAVTAGGHKSVTLEAERALRIAVATYDGKPIETFEQQLDDSPATYVFNVAQASPFVEWTATYGERTAPPPRFLGAPHWTTTEADHVFEQPPETLSTRHNSGTTRLVLEGFRGADSRVPFEVCQDDACRATITRAHARWDDADSRSILDWLGRASELEDAAAIISLRLGRDPLDVPARRAQIDLASPSERKAICAELRKLAAAAAHNSDAAYLVARCTEDPEARDQALLTAQRTHPNNGWLALAAGSVLAEQKEWERALGMFMLARSKAPAVDAHAGVLAARVLRVRDGAANADADMLGRLAESSPQLRSMLELEAGNGLEGMAKAYHLLLGGDLEGALQVAKSAPEHRPRLLRLVAASDGAPLHALEEARALSHDQGMDDDTVWAAIALALRDGLDPAPFATKLGETLSAGDASAVLRLASDAEARRDEARVDHALRALFLTQRAQAYAMLAVIEGPSAPATWRVLAMNLLFPTERPYFAENHQPPL